MRRETSGTAGQPRCLEPLGSAPSHCREGWTGFFGTPARMSGKVLGPRGLMPNPRVGTVTMDVTSAVKGAKGGAVEFRVEKAGVVQAGVGKASFSEKQLVENIKAFVDAVVRAKPPGAKGNYLNKVSLSSSQGVGVKVDTASVAASA